MANLMTNLKNEISRIAKKECKQGSEKLRADNVKMRKEISALKKEIASLKKGIKSTLSAAPKAASVSTPKAVSSKKETVSSKAPRIRPNGKKVTALRTKFGMSQDEFAKLLGIGRITVCRWENTEETIRFKGDAIRQKLADAMKMGKKEAWAVIGSAPQKAPRRGRRKSVAKK